MVKHRRLRDAAGFTLIELLVAISILAIVAVLGWRGLDSIVRTRVALTTELENTRGLQLTFAQMQSDCENVPSTLSFPTDTTVLAVDTGRLTLVRTVMAENQPSSMQVVAYRIKDGVLSRRESRTTRDLSVLNVFWRTTLDDNDSAPSVALRSGIDSMSLLVWGSLTGAWQPQTPTSGVSEKGLAVEIKLHGSETGISKIFLVGAL